MNPRAQAGERPDDASAGPAAAQGEAPPFWEWVAAAVGLVLLLASIGYLAWDAVAHPATPPAPAVEVSAVHRQEGRWLVQLRVHNHGTRAAGALKVVGELQRDGRAVEQAETEFQHVPGRSWREGGLFFERDPAAHRLEVRVKSYQQP